MSISPQSLARTRDKRNLRIPRKFEDFSLVTPGETHTVPQKKYRPMEPDMKFLSEEGKDSEDSSENLDQDVPITTKAQLEELFKPQTEQPPVKPQTSEKPAKSQTDQPVKSQTDQPIKKIDDNVMKKSPFQPSMTISNGIRISGPVTKPLAEKKSASSTPTPAPPAQGGLGGAGETPPPSASKSSSRKKSRGFSLMLKPPNSSVSPNQGNNKNNVNNNNSNGTPNRPIIAQQPTKYNLPQNMQYGTRLMINEPIYLPRSVASIAPITTTLQQIVNQARKPPFLSRKAEAYIAYQEERKLDYITSSYTALRSITKYLEVRDLLNLRAVNKTWKSIIDSDFCWKKVTLRDSRIVDWDAFVAILIKYKTTELCFDEFTPSTKTSSKILSAFHDPVLYLNRISIRSVNEVQNKFAIELAGAFSYSALCWRQEIKIDWQVKVMVDECGLAWISTRCKDPKVARSEARHSNNYAYFYEKLPCLLGDPDKTILVELTDLEDPFIDDKREIDASKPTAKSARGIHVEIQPI